MRKSILLTLTAIMISTLSLTAMAQRLEKKPAAAVKRPELIILEVVKREARTNAVSAKTRTVQVDAKMKAVLPAAAKLQMVEWILNTVNSDGSTSQGKKIWEARNVDGQSILTCTIDLPMATGIIAERFTLSATAEIIHEGVAKRVTTSKSGRFAR